MSKALIILFFYSELWYCIASNENERALKFWKFETSRKFLPRVIFRRETRAKLWNFKNSRPFSLENFSAKLFLSDIASRVKFWNFKNFKVETFSREKLFLRYWTPRWIRGGKKSDDRIQLEKNTLSFFPSVCFKNRNVIAD